MKIRYRKLIARDLQVRMTVWFLLCGLLAIGLQFILTINTMTSIAMETHASPGEAYDAVATGARRILVSTVVLALPITALVGVMVSFRVCGPLVRMRRFLNELVSGGRPEDVRLRKGDELHDFAGLLNEATRPLREQDDSSIEEEEARAA